MKLFLVVYDRRRGMLVSLDEFPPDQRSHALERRAELELAEREKPEIEVVVLAADSLDALKRTHSRYFGTLEEKLEGLDEDMARSRMG